jgi:hypothetical protein
MAPIVVAHPLTSAANGIYHDDHASGGEQRELPGTGRSSPPPPPGCKSRKIGAARRDLTPVAAQTMLSVSPATFAHPTSEVKAVMRTFDPVLRVDCRSAGWETI